MKGVKTFKIQIDELKHSIIKWKSDVFPSLFVQSQNPIIANVDILLVNKVVFENGKVDARFFLHYDNFTTLHRQLFDRISEREIIILNHFNRIEKLPDSFKEKISWDKTKL
jgi:hypothetical protein